MTPGQIQEAARVAAAAHASQAGRCNMRTMAQLYILSLCLHWTRASLDCGMRSQQKCSLQIIAAAVRTRND